MTAPLCDCHGEPMLWSRDSRYRAGGFWACRAKNRDACGRRYANDETRERYLAQKRRRYDTDPVFRIEKRLRDDARSRAATLKRRRESLGSLPE